MDASESALAFAASVREALMVDDAFARAEPDGFCWWPHRLRQRVSVEEPARREGDPGGLCRLTVETEVLVSPREAPRVDASLTELARFPPMAGFLRDAASDRVSLFSAVSVPAEAPAYLAPLVAVAASLQATYAELGLESLVRETGLSPAFSDHPAAGPRPHPDGMLQLAAARVVPSGEGASRWAESEDLLAVADAFAHAGHAPNVDPRGVSVRFPFRRGVTEPLAARNAALLQLRVDAPHPELGYGAFLRLFLPGGGVAPTAATAVRLNGLERGRGVEAPDALGSWTLERPEAEVTGLAVLPGPVRLAFVVFLPNFVKVPGLLRDAALGMERRASWAAGLLAG